MDLLYSQVWPDVGFIGLRVYTKLTAPCVILRVRYYELYFVYRCH